MNKDEFNHLIKSMDIYDKNIYNEILVQLKHNFCQNLRIARKLSKMELDYSAQLLDLQPQSLRRLEARNDRDEFSSKIMIMAIMIYNQDANFYFKKWQENELLLHSEENN